MTGTIKRRGRPAADPFDVENRRQVYRRLKSRLGMSSVELAKLTGLTAGTVRNLPGTASSPTVAPTHTTLRIMRQELVRRARQAVDEAETQYVAAMEMEAIVTAAERRLGIHDRRAA